MLRPTAPPRRSLIRIGAIGAVLATSVLLGAPAVGAAAGDRPVIALDPPDAGVLLIPQENAGLGWFDAAEESLSGGGGAVSAAEESPAGVEESPAAVALARARELLPPEVAEALGASGGVSAESHGVEGAVDVPYGGTVLLELPALVDASEAVFTLELEPPDEDTPPRSFRSDAPVAGDSLGITPLDGNRYSVALPAPVAGYGDQAVLVVEQLGTTQAGTEIVIPLFYVLEFTGLPPSDVTLRPTLGILSSAACGLLAEEICTGPTVPAGSPLDLVVPSSSLLTTLGHGRLDSAVFALGALREDGTDQTYDSVSDPSLVAVHGPSSATLHVPDGAPSGRYDGIVVEGDLTTGFAATFFSFELAEVPVNPGLHSDTGWVDEVREVSAGSTAAVAGGALLLVGGLVTVAAVRPGRRPPLGG